MVPSGTIPGWWYESVLYQDTDRILRRTAAYHRRLIFPSCLSLALADPCVHHPLRCSRLPPTVQAADGASWHVLQRAESNLLPPSADATFPQPPCCLRSPVPSPHRNVHRSRSSEHPPWRRPPYPYARCTSETSFAQLGRTPPDLQTGIPVLKLHGYEHVFRVRRVASTNTTCLLTSLLQRS